MSAPIDLGFPVFVFGSNLAGQHGKGAALSAWRHYGAQGGQGEGPAGRSYAIPTKDEQLRTLPLERIEQGVRRFIAHAADLPKQHFLVTPIGTGLAGYQHDQIAPLFAQAPDNCLLPGHWMAPLDRPVHRLVVAGSRSIKGPEQVEPHLDRCLSRLRQKWPETAVEIISGGAQGVDRIGEQWAAKNGLRCWRMQADWDRLGRAAGCLRNDMMAVFGTHLAAIWDEISPGTAHMIEAAKRENLSVAVFPARPGR